MMKNILTMLNKNSKPVTWLTAFGAILWNVSANAQSTDWAEPVSKIVETLNSGLVTVGTLFVGLAIIGFGFYQAVSGEFKGKRLALMVLGGVCIIAGPEIMEKLLQALK